MTATPPPAAPPTSPPPQVEGRKSSALAVGALILGIGGIVPCLGALLGVTGIVLGIVALAKNAGGKGLAVGGSVAGIVGMIIGQVLATSMLVRYPLLRAREQAKQALCGGNLNAIGKAIAMYGIENQDAFPPDLDVLIAEGTVIRKMLQCPSVERNRRCDYFYLPPSVDTTEDGADLWDDMGALVACDFKGNHRNVRNVLYAAGNVRRLSEKAFQAELAKPINAAFATALRKAEGP